MSGGHFDYQQYKIEDIAKEIERVVYNNGANLGYITNFNSETLSNLSVAVVILRLAYLYSEQVDALLSGDSSEESFNQDLIKSLKRFAENHPQQSQQPLNIDIEQSQDFHISLGRDYKVALL